MDTMSDGQPIIVSSNAKFYKRVNINIAYVYFTLVVIYLHYFLFVIHCFCLISCSHISHSKRCFIAFKKIYRCIFCRVYNFMDRTIFFPLFHLFDFEDLFSTEYYHHFNFWHHFSIWVNDFWTDDCYVCNSILDLGRASFFLF